MRACRRTAAHVPASARTCKHVDVPFACCCSSIPQWKCLSCVLGRVQAHWRPTWRRAAGSSAELRSTPWCATPHAASASLDLSDSTHNTGTCAGRTACSQTCRPCMNTRTSEKYSDWLHAAEAHLVAALDAAGALSHAAPALRLQTQAPMLMLTESRLLIGAASWQDIWRTQDSCLLQCLSSPPRHTRIWRGVPQAQPRCCAPCCTASAAAPQTRCPAHAAAAAAAAQPEAGLR